MSKTHKNPSIKKNFAYSTFFQVLSIITPFITAPYLSRVLGASAIGVNSYTVSIEAYFALFATLGTAGYGSRAISRTRENKKEYSKLFWEIELLSVLTSLICILAWTVVLITSKTYTKYFAILTMNLFGTMFNITWLFKGLEKFKLTVIRDTVFKIAGIIAIFAFVKKPEDLWLYMVINSVSVLLSSLSLWSYLPKILDKVPLKELRVLRHFKETLIYFVPTIATSVYTVLDKTLIGLITDQTTENGYYEQAEKIINMAKSVSFSALDSVMCMRISYLFAKGEIEEIKRRTEYSFNYIFFMSIGCALGIAGVARNFVPIFFGEGYDKVTTLLYVFAPIIVIVGISVCLGGHYYTPIGKRTTSAKFLIIGACVNLVLNLLMIPHFGSVGAAVASVIAESVISALYVIYSNGFCTFGLLVRTGGKKLAAGVVMFAVVWLTGELNIVNGIVTLGVQLVSGVLSYIIVLVAIRDKWTISFIKQFTDKFFRRIKGI
jgi:O-antigen/teichoic acid export membrane protein